MNRKLQPHRDLFNPSLIMNKDYLPAGTKVLVSSSGTPLDGNIVTICGISSTPQPIIGASYIVNFPEELRTQYYNYTHCMIFEVHLTVVEDVVSAI